MRIRLLTAFASVSLLLGGCAGVQTGQQQIDTSQSSLYKSTNVIQSLASLSYADSKPILTQLFAMDASATVLQDEGTRRFVKGFRLPDDQQAFSISLGSYRVGTIDDPAIFYPEVWLLDSNFRIVRRVAPDTFSYRSKLNGSGLFGTIFFNAENANEKYMVITSREPELAELKRSQDNITSAAVVAVPIPAGVIFWSVPVGSNTKPIPMRALGTGNIEISIATYKPSKIGAQ
ncbi:MAG: MalM family protein [Pseudomonadota bacterium]